MPVAQLPLARQSAASWVEKAAIESQTTHIYPGFVVAAEILVTVDAGYVSAAIQRPGVALAGCWPD
jgi:hypothetical protein